MLVLIASLPGFGQTPVTDFGQVHVNASGSPQTVSFSFSGLTAQPTFSLHYAKDFAVLSSSCNPGWTTCSLSIVFSPKSAGVRQDEVVAETTAGALLSTALLRGTGLAPQLAFIPGVFLSVPPIGLGVQSIAVDSAGNIFTAAYNENLILKVDSATGASTIVAGSNDGNTSYSGDGGPATSAHLYQPSAIALDAAGNLFIVDALHWVVRRVDAATQIITTVAGNGTFGFAGDGGPAVAAELDRPYSLAIDLAGNLFIGETARVRKVNAATGIISTVAGTGVVGDTGDGGPATSAQINYVVAVAVDHSGNLYIGEDQSDYVRRVDASTGIISTVAGVGHWAYSGDAGPAAAAGLYGPYGLAFDTNDNLYISDKHNNVIRKIDASTGIITTVAGNHYDVLGQQSPQNGSPANSTAIFGPGPLVVDATGAFYVQTDSGLLLVNSSSSRFIFPQTSVGSTSAAQNLTISNIGNDALTLSAISVSGAFVIQNSGSNACSVSTPLAPNGSCQLSVAYAPTTAAQQGLLTIADNSGNQSHERQVTLTGPYSTVTLSPTSVDFNTVYLGSTSSMLLDIANNGDINLNISGVTITGPEAGDFSFQYSYCDPLLPTFHCSVTLGFKPSALGQRTATLTITDNAPDSPQTVTLTGTAALPPYLVASPAILSFPPQSLFSQSAPQTVTLTNGGGGPLTLAYFAIQYPSFSIASYGCSILQDLAPGESCTISVTFEPLSAGITTGQLKVLGSNDQPAFYVPLVGIGLGAFGNIPGALEHISVGSGSVWGLNAAGQIYAYDQSTNSWIYVPGWLTQLSVGSSSTIWGLNGYDEIFRWDQASRTWDRIPGSLAQISVASDGDVWGLNSEHRIYHYAAQTASWTQIPGELATISAGFDDAVWGLNFEGTPYRYNAAFSRFDQTPGSFTNLQVGADGDVWAQNGAQIYHFNRLVENWSTVAAGPTSLSVGGGGTVWGLDAAGHIFEFSPTSESWINVPGSLSQIGASQDGAMFGINASGQTFFYPSGGPSPSFHPLSGALSSISVAADGSAWGLDSQGFIYTFDSLSQSWVNVPGNLAQIAVAPAGIVWGINSAGQIFRYNPTAATWDWIPGALAQIAVGANGDVWGLNAQDQIYRYDAARQIWDWIPGSLVQISVGIDGAVWGLNSAGQIYRFNASSRSWINVPGSLQQISVGSGSEVWGVNESGQIYHYNAGHSSWDLIPGYAQSLAAGYDGTVFIVAFPNVSRFDASSQTFILAGSNMQQLAVASDGVVWGLDQTGFAYRYW